MHDNKVVDYIYYERCSQANTLLHMEQLYFIVKCMSHTHSMRCVTHEPVWTDIAIQQFRAQIVFVVSRSHELMPHLIFHHFFHLFISNY